MLKKFSRLSSVGLYRFSTLHKGFPTLNQILSQEKKLNRSTFSNFPGINPPPTSKYCEHISVGLSHLQKADTKKAAQHFEKAYKLSIQTYGEDTKTTAECLNYLAQTHQLENNFDNALSQYKKALKILQRQSAFCPLLLSDINHHMSEAYQSIGDLPKALDHNQTSLELIMEHSPTEYKRMNLILQSLGKVYLLMGDLAEAKDFYKRALEMLSLDPKETEKERSLLYDKMGTLMEKEGKVEEAINLKKIALEIQKKVCIEGDDSPLFAQHLNLAALYERSEKYQESLKSLEEAFGLLKDKKCRESQHKGAILVRMGEMHMRLGNANQAQEKLEAAVAAIEKEELGTARMLKKARRLLTQTNLQRRSQGKRLEAERADQEEIVMESRVPDNIEEAEKYRKFGMEYFAKNDFESAKYYLRKAIQAYAILKGPESPVYQEIKKLLIDANKFSF